MIKSAYLRVYDPEDIVTASVDVLPRAVERQHRLGWSSYGLVDESMDEDLFVADWNGNRYVCPRRPRLRMLEGVLAFHNAFAGGEVLVPETVAANAAAELEQIRDREPEQRSHILTSPWHVPLRWFVAFEPHEREMVETDSGVSIRYRSDRRSATARLESALAILESVGMDDAVIDNVRELNDWLSKFSPSGLVELDYGGTAGLFADADIVFDESCSDVWASIRALEANDFEESAVAYNRVAGRWSHAVAVTYLN